MNPRRSVLPARPLFGRRAAPALRFGIATAVLAVSVGLAGCAPAPAPKPTPTALFASEAEAFKAAEQVYRDYVDALNGRNTGETDAHPERLLGGKALEFDIESVRSRQERGIRVNGDTLLRSFRGVDVKTEPASTVIHSDACVDVSGTRLVDSSGSDVTPPDRQPSALLRVTMNQSKRSLIITDTKLTADHC